MSYTKTDIKSARDLGEHLDAFGLDATKAEVERVRDDARQFTPPGSGPATPEGAHNHNKAIRKLGVARDYKG